MAGGRFFESTANGLLTVTRNGDAQRQLEPTGPQRGELDMTKNDARNLNPHKAAVMAMCLFSRRYAAQNGGSMDFWESLSTGEQKTCRDLVARLEQAPPEVPRQEALKRLRTALAK